MTSHSDAILFGHMLDAARKAVEFSRDRKRDELDRDELYALAMARLLTVVGEAAARVSPEGRGIAPNVPWQQITGTRNRLIHGYAEVNPDIVWTILTDDLPSLIDELEKAVAPD